MKKLIIYAVVVTLFIAILIKGVLVFLPGVGFLIPQVVFESLPYSMNERIMLIQSSKRKIVEIAESFYKRLNLPFPKINDFSKEIILLSEAMQTGDFAPPPQTKILIEIVISGTRRYPTAQLWLASNHSYCMVDYKRKEVSHYRTRIADVIDMIEKGSITIKKLEETLRGDSVSVYLGMNPNPVREEDLKYLRGRKQSISQDVACRLAEGYLDIIGRPTDAGKARLESQLVEGFYMFYIPRVVDSYEYDSDYSGIRIIIDNKDGGRLLEYWKFPWDQKTSSVTLKISKEEALRAIKNYPWKNYLTEEHLKISEPLETGDPQISIVSPNYWPNRWKRILFETNLKGRLVWKVPVKFLKMDEGPKWINIYVDAKNGKIVGREESIVILSGAY